MFAASLNNGIPASNETEVEARFTFVPTKLKATYGFLVSIVLEYIHISESA